MSRHIEFSRSTPSSAHFQIICLANATNNGLFQLLVGHGALEAPPYGSLGDLAPIGLPGAAIRPTFVSFLSFCFVLFCFFIIIILFFLVHVRQGRVPTAWHDHIGDRARLINISRCKSPGTRLSTDHQLQRSGSKHS